MKHIIGSLLVLLVFFVVTPGVSAHTLKVDGTIGVTLHVEPDDQPVAGIESKMFVDITDSAGRFNPSNPGNCACVMHIEHNGQRVKSIPVVSGGSFTQIRYTFPEAGTYTILIEGQPQGEGVPFQQFHVAFETYAAPGGVGDQLSSGNALGRYLPYAAAVVGIVLVLLFVW